MAIGSVHVDVYPSTADFITQLRDQILGGVDEIGRELGNRIGDAATGPIRDGISEGIVEGIEESDGVDSAGRAGRRSGDAFGRSMREEINAALRNLPDIEIDADVEGALSEIGLIRADLRALNLDTVDLNLNADEAFARINELQARLEVLSHSEEIDIRVKYDIDQASEALAKLQEKIANDQAGAFDSTLRSGLDRAIASLPKVDIPIDADPTQADIKLLEVGEKLRLLAQLSHIDLNINGEEALADVERLAAELRAIANETVDVKIYADATAALAQLEAISKLRPVVEAEVELDAGSFVGRLQAAIHAAQATLPDIQVNADTSPADREIAGLKVSLLALHATIDVNADTAAVKAELDEVRLAALRIAALNPTVRVNADISDLLAKLAVAEAATEGVSKSINDAAGSSSRWQLILALIVALLPVIAGAVLALPAALFLVLGPLAAVAAGFAGIKTAVEPLQEQLDNIGRAASAAFRQGLIPAVQDAGRILDALLVPVTDVSIHLSDVATHILDIASSSTNLDRIVTIFDNVSASLVTIGPAIGIFLDNVLNLAAVGSGSLITFGTQITGVARDFQDMITHLEATGIAQAAITNLFSTLSALVGLIGPLVNLGAAMSNGFSPALNATLNGIGGALNLVAGALETIPGPIGAVITAFGLFKVAMLVLGDTGTAAVARLTGAISTAKDSTVASFAVMKASAAEAASSFEVSFGAGVLGALKTVGSTAVAAGKAIYSAFGGGIGIVIGAIIAALSLLGDAQQKASEKAADYSHYVDDLTAALGRSGGAIDDNITLLEKQQLASSDAKDALGVLGDNINTVAGVVAKGGPTFDAYVQHLKDIILQADKLKPGQLAGPLLAQKAAAQQVLDVIGPLAQGFSDAASSADDEAKALASNNISLIDGVGNAKQLSDALGVLADKMATTSSKADALKDALDALNGGQIDAQRAEIAQGEAVKTLSDNLDQLAKAGHGVGEKFIDLNGDLDLTTYKGVVLAKGADSIRTAMVNAATGAFQAAGGLSNVNVAADAAGKQVEIARQGFIKNAEAAGATALQANNLADKFQLIPGLVETLLRAVGVPEVTQQLNQVEGRINAVPGAKEVDFKTGELTAQTIATLKGIGVTVETLPDGTVKVDLNDKTPGEIQAALDFIDKSHATVPVTADTTQIPPEIQAQIDALMDEKHDLPVTASLQRDAIDAQIAALKASITNPPTPLPVTADTDAALAVLSTLSHSIDTSVATISIDGNKLPATDALNAVLQAITAGKAFVTIDGNKVPVAAALADVLAVIGKSGATVTINGQNEPAAQVLEETLNAIAHGQANVTIDGVSLPAQEVLAALLAHADNTPAVITAIANSAAADAVIDYAARNRTAVITVTTQYSGSSPGAIRQIDDADTGGYNPAATPVPSTNRVGSGGSFAQGGISAATPAAPANTPNLGGIRGGGGGSSFVSVPTATIVPPPTIPNYNSSGSAHFNPSATLDPSNIVDIRPSAQSLTNNPITRDVGDFLDKLKTGIGNFFGSIGFADGGFHNLTPLKGGVADIVGPNTWRVIGDRANDDEAYIPIDGSTRSKSLLAVTAQRLGFDLSPLGGSGPQGGSAFLNGTPPRASAGDQNSATATQTARLEAKFDALTEAVKKNKGGNQFNVQAADNPIETARAIQLRMRLS